MVREDKKSVIGELEKNKRILKSSRDTFIDKTERVFHFQIPVNTKLTAKFTKREWSVNDTKQA